VNCPRDALTLPAVLRLAVPILLLLAIIGALVATDHPRPPADFTFINRGDVTTLDVQRVSWMQDMRVARCLYEGLVRNDVFTREFKVVPAGAESWDISPDGLVYTFHLRRDARWSNGLPVRAQDFVYGWRRALLPDTACDYTSQFFAIRGAEDFFNWRNLRLNSFDRRNETAADLWKETTRKFDEMVGVQALDDLTLRVELLRRTPYFLDLCTLVPFYPVCPSVVSRYELPDADTGRLRLEQQWTKPPVIVCNGPFVLTEWRFKRELRLEKNPNYWNRDALSIDSISIPSVEDPNAQVITFGAGGVDWLSEVTPPYKSDMLTDKQRFYDENKAAYDALAARGLDPIEIDRNLPHDRRKNIHAFPAFGTYFFNFNCLPNLTDGRANPFADPRVRRAFIMAIDKERIARDIRRIGERVADALVPPGSIGGYTGPEGLHYNPDKARALLAEAGYPGGRGFISVDILVNKDGGHDIVAQAMAKDLQENLGVNVSIAQKEIKVFRVDLKDHNFMISRAGWYGDYGDPMTFLAINRTGDGNNDRAYSNPKYDALLDQANNEPDPAKRMSILRDAERIIVEDDPPLIPLCYYVNVVAFDPDHLSGITSHPRQEQNLALIDILGDGKGKEKPLSMPPAPPRSMP
jgi:oligopeptide transport system substrate-binding protein